MGREGVVCVVWGWCACGDPGMAGEGLWGGAQGAPPGLCTQAAREMHSESEGGEDGGVKWGEARSTPARSVRLGCKP